MASVSGTTPTTSSNYYLLNTGTNSSLQVSGLASGIDVDSIVNKLMQAESVPLDRMNQQLQLLEWKRDDYRSTNDLLSSLQSIVNTMTLQSSYTKKATVSDPTKLIVTPATSAGNATYTVSGSSSGPTLATVATNQSQNAIATTNFDSSKPLIEQAASLNNTLTWNIKAGNDLITAPADGKTFQLAYGAVDVSTANVSVDGSSPYVKVSSKDQLDSNSSENQVYIDSTTGQMTFNHDVQKDSTISIAYQYKTVDIDITTYDSNQNPINKTLNLNGSLSLDSMLQKLNASGAGVNAFYDSSTQKVAISTTQTGQLNPDSSGQEMNFTSSFLTTTLDLQSSNESGGTDAHIVLNGLETTRHSNTFTVNNTTFTLTDEIPSTQTITVGINTDTDAVFNQVKSFVDQYNDTIKKINDMISTPPNRDYPPLTSVQKAQMKDSDITNWTDIAKQGTLYNDSILNSALTQMRQDLYNTVSGITGGSYSQLAQIGITTSSDYRDHGKLVIDESKLKEAISQDSDGVMKLFTNGNSYTGDNSSRGIAKRLYNTLNDTISKVKEQAGNTSLVNNQFYIGRSIDDLTDQISTFQDHLKMIQTRYYTQFTAMEQAIQQANSQASYLQNTFS